MLTQLTPDQISKIADVVKDPKFDIYVGKSDDTIRRLSVSVDFTIPSAQRAQFQGAEGGTLSFSIDGSELERPTLPEIKDETLVYPRFGRRTGAGVVVVDKDGRGDPESESDEENLFVRDRRIRTVSPESQFKTAEDILF